MDHTTIYRWVQRYAPELEKRCHPHLKTTSDSWRVRTLQGYEIMNMIRKGQIRRVEKGNIMSQIMFISSLFGVVA